MTENILSWPLTLINKEGEIGYRLVKAPLAPFMALLIPQLTETRKKREISSDDNAQGYSLIWAILVCAAPKGMVF